MLWATDVTGIFQRDSNEIKSNALDESPIQIPDVKRLAALPGEEVEHGSRSASEPGPDSQI